MSKDKISWKAQWTVTKFIDPTGEIAMKLQAGEDVNKAGEFYDQSIIEDNIALNEGLQAIIELICGISTPTKWDSSNAYLGVGTSSTAAAATDTGLLGTAVYKAMDSTYPQRSGQIAIWRSTFASGDANQAWEEYTVSNSNSNSGVNLNRKCESKGTKASGESWTLELRITFS